MSHGFPKTTRRQRAKRAHAKKIVLRPKPTKLSEILEPPNLEALFPVVPVKPRCAELFVEALKPSPMVQAIEESSRQQ